MKNPFGSFISIIHQNLINFIFTCFWPPSALHGCHAFHSARGRLRASRAACFTEPGLSAPSCTGAVQSVWPQQSASALRSSEKIRFDPTGPDKRRSQHHQHFPGMQWRINTSSSEPNTHLNHPSRQRLIPSLSFVFMDTLYSHCCSRKFSRDVTET